MKPFKPSSIIFLLTVPWRYIFYESFVLFMSCVCHVFAPVIAALWSHAFLALVCDVDCVFVTFLCGILGLEWYLIVLVPDICHLSYYYNKISMIYQVKFKRYRK